MMPRLTRRTALSLLAGTALTLGVSRTRACAEEASIVLETPTGRIEGTLALPAGTGPVPVALIIAGSGPTDRDGNTPILPGKNDALRLVAQALTARGIASIRYDKRGIGASRAAMTAEADLRFETYVDDAAAWLQLLSRDVRFRHVFVVGHSEGSLIGMIAAARANADGYVSLTGIARPAAAVIHEQLTKGGLPTERLAQADAIMAQLGKGEQVADVPSLPIFQGLFRPSVQPYLISWFRYDPRVEIGKLRCPIAIVGGTNDLQVPASDAEALKTAAPAATLVLVNGMNHTLKHVEGTSREAQAAAYSDPVLPVEPRVVETIATLVRAVR